jgi:hypothetical protein
VTETREQRIKRLAADGGWIGVDLDGTLAVYHGWRGPLHVGEPIPRMVERIRQWIAAGVEVRIFTARASEGGFWGSDGDEAIQSWCREHLGTELPITCTKDFKMIELWDDRAVQVVENTGEALSETNTLLEADAQRLVRLLRAEGRFGAKMTAERDADGGRMTLVIAATFREAEAFRLSQSLSHQQCRHVGGPERLDGYDPRQTVVVLRGSHRSRAAVEAIADARVRGFPILYWSGA